MGQMTPRRNRPFLPGTCHPVLTRRQVLLGGGALIATGALGGRGQEAFAKVTDDGVAIIRQYVTLPDDPWMVAHGLRAMGRTFTLGDGRRAIDYLLETV